MDPESTYEPLILVTRGDEMPKKNYERKLHPTYEVSEYSKPALHYRILRPYYRPLYDWKIMRVKYKQNVI